MKKILLLLTLFIATFSFADCDRIKYLEVVRLSSSFQLEDAKLADTEDLTTLIGNVADCEKIAVNKLKTYSKISDSKKTKEQLIQENKLLYVITGMDTMIEACLLEMNNRLNPNYGNI